MRCRDVWPVALMAIASACTTHHNPGLTVEGQPLGAEVRAKNVSTIAAVFSHPMVDASEVGKPARATLMKVSPLVAGALRWATPSTLAFFPTDTLPGSTEFQVEVSQDAVSLDNFTSQSRLRWSFTTERQTGSLTLHRTGHANPETWATPDQALALTVTQAVRPETVEHACAFKCGQETVGVAVQGAGQEPGTRFEIVPKAPLRLGSSWTLRCETTLVPEGGMLGPLDTIERTFSTFDEMKVVGVAPYGVDVDTDDTELVVTFTTPPAGSVSSLPIQLTPAVEGVPDRFALEGATLRVTLHGLAPTTDYTIHVGDGITDVFGQHLKAPSTTVFHTGDARPRLDVDTGVWVVEAARGAYPLWVRNLSTLQVQGASIPPEKVGRVGAAVDWWDDAPLDPAKVKLAWHKQKLAVPPRLNHWQQFELSPAKALGTADPLGIFYFAVQAPEIPESDYNGWGNHKTKELIVNFTNLGLTSKLGTSSGLAWVTKLDDGQPAVGAEVFVLDARGKEIARERTDQDGIATIPGRSRFAAPQEHKGDLRDNEEHYEQERGTGGEAAGKPLIFAKLGDDITWVNPEQGGGLSSWNFHIDHAAQGNPIRGFLHSDRGLYRPGDTVHLRGLVRVMSPGVGLRVPDKAAVRVAIKDPMGHDVLTRKPTLSEFGSFSLDTDLTADAHLGDYVVEAEVTDSAGLQGSVSEHFTVEEYRPAAFEVKAQANAREYIVGQALHAKVEGRYFYGAPIRGAKASWTVHTRRRDVSFDGFPGYDFEDERNATYWTDRSHDSEMFVSERQTTLRSDGTGELTVDLPASDYPHRAEVRVTASVQDETNQAIAASVVVPVDPTSLYFGIATEGYVATTKKASTVRVVAVDTAGKRTSATAKLSVLREDYSCAWEAWGYRGSYRCEEKTSPVASQDVTISDKEPLAYPFVPGTGGSYLIVVEGRDEAGRKVMAATRLYAWGDDEPAWRASDSDRFDIVADKDKYAPGETAHLLLKAPMKGALGLVTVERESILERRLVTFSKGAESVDVPIQDAYGPNVYVSVMLVTGRTAPGARGLPSMRMGLINLPVEAGGKRLSVHVTTDQPAYRPGDDVTVSLRVTSADGAPVKAEVALAAADEGVLSLIGFRTPDPQATFYAPWGLGLVTATQYERLAKLPDPGQERYATGGDGAGRFGTMRSRFRATAYWNPQIVTDDQGAAQVTFKAPDNLTAFRLMAVAADASDKFGSADQRFTVRKPLQLISALPRFVDVGDSFKAGVLVMNETGSAGDVQIEVAADGIELVGPTHQKVAVASGGRVPVYVNARATRRGEAKLRFAASLGTERDGIEVKLPVEIRAPVETLLLGEGQTSSRVELPLHLPEGLLPETATIEVSMDPNGLSGIEEGLRDLIQYPYGCLEQTTSRLIPLVMVSELAKSLQLGIDGPELQSFIRAGVTKIQRHQNEDGGFSLWPGGQSTSYLSAYALWGLKVAKDAGYEVSDQRVRDGVAYLRTELAIEARAERVHVYQGELASRAFALYVMSLWGQAQPSSATQLFEKRAQLPRYGMAYLARALAASLGPDDASVATVLDELAKAAEVTGDSAVVLEPDASLRWYMSDDVRTTAMVLDAYVSLRPSDPLLPQLVRGLMHQRRNDARYGAWETTQDDLYALVGLTHYARSRQPSDVAVNASVGGKQILKGRLPKEAGLRIVRATVPLPDASAGGAPLVIEAKGGTSFYSARVRFQRDMDHQKATSSGFTLTREVLDPRLEKPVAAIHTGDTVLVRLTVSTPEERTHVAITDYLPAGFEPVQTKFVTSGATEKPAEDEQDWRYEYCGHTSHRELRDDRVDIFADYYCKGTFKFEYLAKATTAGSFVMPGAMVEEMYAPEVYAVLSSEKIEIRAK